MLEQAFQPSEEKKEDDVNTQDDQELADMIIENEDEENPKDTQNQAPSISNNYPPGNDRAQRSDKPY